MIRSAFFQMSAAFKLLHHVRKLVCCGLVLLASGAIVKSATVVSAKSKLAQHYQKLLEDEIGRRWYNAVDAYSKQLPQEAIRVHFFVTRDRHIRVVQVTPSKPNDLLTKLTLEVLSQAEVPAIPRELLAHPDQLEFELGFNFYVH